MYSQVEFAKRDVAERRKEKRERDAEMKKFFFSISFSCYIDENEWQTFSLIINSNENKLILCSHQNVIYFNLPH
jgi:hypothetical protein